ncbi:hypothetical protein KP509_10G015200 [Ceratopteris richardii]|uniref:Longin domain-containing protein n=1 Tax=Ceratopteris richardii TaxID=49495 RepID=A0A8T2TT02_CERRI|nr:hypothetical protein KP509_10G015200 [Ceratopteris richardii]KAH7426739.1 hypothetical protein KP509_10G015200 [Ceratopteris richardii]KAH7426740.1 hypothetical protein KP509_10G015200 [Ceratopteris richardii]KAH7426741.1 hypothetical protein KP509_10G015200 [Ceratopteris richardii]
MVRKSSLSTSSLSYDRTCNPQCNQEKTSSPLPSLIYYSAVAKGTSILSEYTAEGNSELPAVAAICLENAPILHAKFTHTTNQRRFVCFYDGAARYCAILDEALSKDDAYLFLEKVRDDFKAIGKGRGVSLTLGDHFLDEAMVTVMRNLAAAFVGVPQREKDKVQAEHQLAQCDADIDLAISSRSAVAPLHDLNNQEDDKKDVLTNERIPYRVSISLLASGGERGNKKINQQDKVGSNNNQGDSMDIGSASHPELPRGPKVASERSTLMERQKMWRRKISSVAHWINSLS